MAKLLITTQVYENYGDAAEPYWKAKGGRDFVVKNFRDFGRLTQVVMALRGQIESDTEYFREYILDWEVVADDYLTEFERSQLKYEGSITFSAKEIELA
jgi:hypothetical protein